MNKLTREISQNPKNLKMELKFENIFNRNKILYKKKN